ncbi:MAG: CHRD domain-containing protein [Acidobacteriia bacterium]|nr:CHRD domain-containing protein [Terriglobia bacterium]
MKNLTLVLCAVLLLVCASGLWADDSAACGGQRANTIPFLAFMQATNEVPTIVDTSVGNIIVWVHVVCDSGGKNILSGTVDFDLVTRFSGAVTANNMHIHHGPAGVSAAVVIPTDIGANAANNIAIDATGKASIFKQVNFPDNTINPATTVDVIQDMLQNPSQYYANIHTTDHPGGAMRGQLVKADMTVLMGLMKPANEIPAVPPSNASGIASVTALRARDSSGNVVQGAAIFNLIYSNLDAVSGTTFTGFHIHGVGAPGVTAGVVLNTGIAAGANAVQADPSGSGTLNRRVDVSPPDAQFAAEVNTLNDLFNNPSSHYINLHTTVNPGGTMRDQVRRTEKSVAQVILDPANETPPVTGLSATATTQVPIFVVRNADGTIAAGTVVFDVNFRGFPANTTFNNMHIHQGAAGVNGSPVIFSGLDNNANKVVTASGNGNIQRIVTVADTAGIAALAQLMQTPNGFYENLHTAVNPNGAMRAQLAPALATPTITKANANNAPTITAGAPGSAMSIFGTNLVAFGDPDLSDVIGLTAVPTSIDGVTATIGGVKAPIYGVIPGQMNVQVPFEVPAGNQQLVITTPAGPTTAFSITVNTTAPAILTGGNDLSIAVVTKPDFSLVSATNPAKAGDVLTVWSIGLGQTTPPMTTGALLVLPSSGFNNTAGVTATLGGQTANVIGSVGSPGFVGLYQVAVQVPSGVSGNAQLVLKQGTATSNTVNIQVASQ